MLASDLLNQLLEMFHRPHAAQRRSPIRNERWNAGHTKPRCGTFVFQDALFKVVGLERLPQ